MNKITWIIITALKKIKQVDMIESAGEALREGQ